MARSDLPAAERTLGLAAMVAACAIWGWGPIWIRGLLDWLPAVDVCLLRVTLGGVTVAVWLLLFERRSWGAAWRRPAAWAGGLAMAGSMLCYAAALRYIRPAEVNLVFQGNIITSATLGWWLFGESVPRRRWPAFAVVLGGVAMVILAREAPTAAVSWGVRLAGMGLGLLGGMGASLTQAAIRETGDRGDGLVALVPMHVMAVAVLLLGSGGHLRWLTAPTVRCWELLLLLGLVGSGVATILSQYGIRRISLAQAGLSGAMQPLTTVLVTWAWGERLPPMALVGGVLVILGVVGSALVEREVTLRPTWPGPGGDED